MEHWKKIITTLAVVLAFSGVANAQKFSVSTNAVDYMNLLTINADAQISLSRHFSLEGQIRYNPWVFNQNNLSKQIQNRKQSYQIGFRFWPWATFSEWWIKIGGQYQNYCHGGFNNYFQGASPYIREGHASGVAFGAGYSLMITKFFNLDFGIEGWGGVDWFEDVTSDKKDVKFREGSQGFLLPNNVYISATFVFGEFHAKKDKKK